MDSTELSQRVINLRKVLSGLETDVATIEGELAVKVKQDLIPVLDRKIRAVQAGTDWSYSFGKVLVMINSSTYETLTGRTLQDLPRFPNTISAGIDLNLTRAGAKVDTEQFSEILSGIRPAIGGDLEGFRRLYNLDDVSLYMPPDNEEDRV